MELHNLKTQTADLFAAGFVLSAISCLAWPSLPSPVFFPILFILAWLCCRFFAFRFLSGALIGTLWIASVGHWQVNWQLPTEEIRQIRHLSGSIDSIVMSQNMIRFTLSASHINNRKLMRSCSFRLSWRDPEWPVKQGQRVSLTVKLKPVHGLANQGGFRYQQWLNAHGIAATGYVKSTNQNVLLSDSMSTRQRLVDHVRQLELTNIGWILALTLGERGALTSDDWGLMQQTGTAHLVAISGLHLGMVAGLCFVVFSAASHLMFAVLRLKQRVVVRNWLLVIVVVMTYCYAHLAGFGLPTLRAWLMITLLSVILLCRWHVTVSRYLLYSFCLIMLVQPLSLLSTSLWLSFSAVVMIILIVWLWTVPKPLPDSSPSYFQTIKTGLIAMVRIQASLCLLMAPLAGMYFSLISLSAPLLNLVAVPLVSFILLPLCLLAIVGVLLNVRFSDNVFILIDRLFDVCIAALTWADQTLISAASVSGAPALVWGLVAIACLACFLPVDWRYKGSAIVLLLPLLSYQLPSRSQTWQVHVMDVGQGLAVVIERNQHAIIYDTGGAFPSGFNMADSVLLPFLQSRGIPTVDYLILSHFDNDHAGSMSALRAGVLIRRMATTEQLCVAGWAPKWQGLQFKTLWPLASSAHSHNDSSCVVHISDQHGSVLLPGDISRSVERQLVRRYPKQLNADLLIAPHHGSNTSSSELFVSAVSPKYVVFSQGHLNRWDFPKQAVVNRYHKANVSMWSTGETGQLTFKVSKQQGMTSATRYRQDWLNNWYNSVPK